MLAGHGDEPAVAALLQGVLDHYGGRALPERAASGAARLCRAERGTFALLARDGGAAVGLACLAEVFPGADLAPVLFLKDLFVTPAARNGGVGHALLRATARLARERGCCRIDWTAADDQPRLHRFYEGFGAVRAAQVIYRLGGEALAALAEEKGR